MTRDRVQAQARVGKKHAPERQGNVILGQKMKNSGQSVIFCSKFVGRKLCYIKRVHIPV
jgi:hypothetical protein